MSRILQPRRAKTTIPRPAPEGTVASTVPHYSEMKTNARGESILDLSEGFTTVVVNGDKMMNEINDMNNNVADEPLGENLYEDVMNPFSQYKAKMIQDTVAVVQRATEYLHEDDDVTHTSYEEQLQNSGAAISMAKRTNDLSSTLAMLKDMGRDNPAIYEDANLSAAFASGSNRKRLTSKQTRKMEDQQRIRAKKVTKNSVFQ